MNTDEKLEGNTDIKANPDKVEFPIFTRDFSVVLDKEKVYIHQRRQRVNEELSEATRGQLDFDGASNPIGLAFSGGGIRSASFNFGVVQGLSEIGFLPLVDYLTSVSGGGFTASCLTSLLSFREDQNSNHFPFNTTWEKFPFNPTKKIFEVDGNTSKASFGGGQNEQLRHLREKGNYLIPRGGALSRDTLRVLGSVFGGMGYIILAYLLAIVAFSALHFGLVALLTGNILTTTEFSISKLFIYDLIPTLPVQLYMIALIAGLILSIITSFVLRIYYDPGRTFQEVKTPIGLTDQDVRDTRVIYQIFWSTLFFLVVLIFGLKLVFRESEQIFWLWLPLLFAVGLYLGLIVYRIGFGRSRYDLSDNKQSSIWSAARFRSIFWAYQGFAIYAVIGALIFTVLALPHFFVVTNPETQRSTSLTMTIISGAGVALLTYLNSQNKGIGGTLQSFISKIPSGLLNSLLGLFVIIFNLSLIFIVEAVINSLPGLIIWTPWVIFGVSIILFGVVLRFININHISPHYFFRDQVGEVFLKTEISNNKGKIILARDQSKVRLTDINPMGCSAPYHIVVGAINLPGSYNLKFKDRKSQHFNFSRDYNGSEVTGFALHNNENRPKKRGYRMGATKYARTIAISGAAASSAIGYVTSFAQAFVLTLFNVRLGLWMINPNRYEAVPEGKYLDTFTKSEEKRFWLKYLIDEMSGKISERRSMVNLSDGGHTGDNGALYPLFQRRCKVIIAGDASQDPQAYCNDLFRVIHYVNVDLGIDVNINVDGLKPNEKDAGESKAGLSKHHCAIGEITYPRVLNDDGSEKYPEEKGWLIYLKPSITVNDRGELIHYWETHKNDFPHPSTIDQFFDEFQFEVQRFLGKFTIQQTLEEFNKLDRYYTDQLTTTSAQISDFYLVDDYQEVDPNFVDKNMAEQAVTWLEYNYDFLLKKREIVKRIQRRAVNYPEEAEVFDSVMKDFQIAMQ